MERENRTKAPREAGGYLYLDGPGYYIKLEYRNHGLGEAGEPESGSWNAVELDQFGGLRARLYDGRDGENARRKTLGVSLGA